MSVALWICAAAALVLAGHVAVNSLLLRRPPDHPADVEVPVAVLLPVRDEAHRVAGCLRALLDQRGVADLRVLVLDDGSTDGTAGVVRVVAGGDPRVRLLTGAPPPPGWLGKPYACHQLAGQAGPDVPVLVFLDADVVLAPHAVAAAVNLLPGFDLLCPFPRIVATSAGERLVQPLLRWSWLSFVPLRVMERTRHPSLAAAGGQFLVASAAGYRRAGGHAAVRDRVLEDIGLARAVIRSGGRTGLANGAPLATCRMYGSWREMAAGYTKSLWAAFGSPAGAVAVAGMLLALYLLPPLVLLAAPVAALAGVALPWVPALVAYLAGVSGRLVAGRTGGSPLWPDALAHPVSIVLFCLLLARSFHGRRRGTLSWKGRAVG